MSIIKPSQAFPGNNWVSGDVQTFIKQLAICVDAVADVNDNDFEQWLWIYVKAKGALYRYAPAEVASDNGNTVLQDNIGRRYAKQASSGGREVLSDDRTYYVRTDGNDSNTGFFDTAGGAFLTIQKAWDTIQSIDLGGHAVVIQVGAGTHTGGLDAASPAIGGLVTLQGDVASPANVVISTTAKHAISNTSGSYLQVKGFKLQTTSSGNCINCQNGGSRIDFSNIDFGACAGRHINAGEYSIVNAATDYAISGSAVRHASVSVSYLGLSGRTVTISGTLAFSQFILADRQSYCNVFGMTFTGSYTVTGQRFNVQSGAIISTGGGGASYFPGSSAGAGTDFSTSPWGLYT